MLGLSKSAIARIERVQVRDVGVIEEWTNCIFTKVRGRAKFISKKAIERDFIESRKQRISLLRVKPISQEVWEVENEVGSRYIVMKEGDYVCNCKDHMSHGQRCKHIWAVVLREG